MRILIHNNFLETVPKEKLKVAYASLNKFYQLGIESNFRYENLPDGFGVKKFDGMKGKVFAFRADRGDRILFTYSSELENYRYDDSAILVMMYTNHDQQNKNAKNVAATGYDFSDFDNIDKIFIEENEHKFNYDLIKSKTLVLEEDAGITFNTTNSVEYYIDFKYLLGKKDILQYRNDEQEKIFQDNGRTLIIAGSAGSGKTMLGIQKLKRMSDLKNNDGKNSKTLYLTYTQKLRNKAADTLADLTTNISFYSLDEFFVYKLDKHIENYVNLTRFIKWYESKEGKNPKDFNLIYSKFNSLDVYSEITGLIKGFMLIDWKRINNLALMLSENEYLGLLPEYSNYERSDRKLVYKIALDYQKYLKDTNKFDLNDLAFEYLGRINEFGKYDYIVLDEVQDLTELQLYVCLQISRSINDVLMSGDTHQVINSVYFNFGRIKNLLGVLSANDKQIGYDFYTLNFNYRSAEEIVKLSNSLSEKRKLLIGSKKQEEEQGEESVSSVFGAIRNVMPSDNNFESLAGILAESPYFIVVVLDEFEKEKLVQRGIDERVIFTVLEVKGLEEKYVLSYNIISSAKKYWQDIISNSAKHSSKHRHYFSLLYVTITRATNSLVFYEDDITDEIYDEIFRKNNIELETEVSVPSLGMVNDFTSEDWYNQGRKREEQQEYKRAMMYYKEANTKTTPIDVRRCEIKAEAVETSNYKRAADLLRNELSEYRDASYYYKQARLYEDYVACLFETNANVEQIASKIRKHKIKYSMLLGKISEERFNLLMEYFLKIGKKITTIGEGINGTE